MAYRSPIAAMAEPPPAAAAAEAAPEESAAQIDKAGAPIPPEAAMQIPPEATDMLFKTLVGAAAGAAAPKTIESALTGVRAIADAVGMPGMSEPEKAALKKIAQALAEDKMTAQEARERIREAAPKMLSLIDAAGKNVLALGRDAVLTPGPARELAAETMRDRQFGNPDKNIEGQVDRVMGDVRTLISPDTDFYGTAKSLADTRRELAKPAYEKAMETGADFSPRIRTLMATPSGKMAMGEAIKIAGDEGVDLQSLMGGLQKNRFTNRQDAMKVLHYFKMGVDQAMEGHMGEDMFGDPKHTTRSYHINENVRQPLIRELDRMNPDYRDARHQYSSYSDSMDALAKGRNFITQDAELTKRDMAAMTTGDREFFRAGVARGIKDLVYKTPDGADVVKRIFGNPQKRAALQTVFGDPALFDEFAKRMGDEATMFNSSREVLGGSQTADKLAAAAHNRLDDPFLNRLFHPDTKSLIWAGANASHGNMTGMLAHLVAPLVGRAQSGMPADVREEVGKKIFDPAQATKALREIEKAGKSALKRASRVRRLAPIGAAIGTAGGAAAAALGGGDDDE